MENKSSNQNGVPVWSHSGIKCTGEIYKKHLRITFHRGSFIDNREGLFNPSIEGSSFRAIMIKVEDRIDKHAFIKLVTTAVSFNAKKK